MAMQRSDIGEDTGYSYDHAWNVSSVTNSSATNAFLVNGLNELTNWAAGAALYDSNGNMTSRVASMGTDYAYDDENRLIGVTNNIVGNTNATYFVYDGLGRLRIRYEITQLGIFDDSGGGITWSYIATAYLYTYDGFRVIQERNLMIRPNPPPNPRHLITPV